MKRVLGAALALLTALAPISTAFGQAQQPPTVISNKLLLFNVALANSAALPAYTYANGVAGVGATITGNANGALSLDSSGVNAGDMVLIGGDGSSLPENGIYDVTRPGDGSTKFLLTRNARANTGAAFANQTVMTGNGGNTVFQALYSSNVLGTIVVGTDPISYNLAQSWQTAVVKSVASPLTIAGTTLGCPTCGTGTGNVTGPVSSTTGHLATFSGSTGKIIQDGGLAAWTAASVSTIGNGLTISAGTISADAQTTQTVSASTATVSPTNAQSVAITLQANTTLTIGAGYDGQHLRLKLIQDGTGSRTVAFDSSVKFGTDITSFTASTAAGTTDIVQIIYDLAHTRWILAAANHGF